MAITCNPESLSGPIECLLCIKGERTSEAVKTYLTNLNLGTGRTPEQLLAAITAAGYNKLTLKQAWQGIVWAICQEGGDNCTPQAMQAASIAFQKFSWQQSQAAIIYLLATAAAVPINGEAMVNTAVKAGYDKLGLKAMRQIQAYLWANAVTAGMTPKQLNTNAECFQCLGKYQLLAMEVYEICVQA